MKTWNHASNGVNMPNNALVRKSIKDSKLKKNQNKDSPVLHPLKKLYSLKRGEISRRLKEFKGLWLEGKVEEIFVELAFCILTPQSKAKVCWNSIERLREKNLLLKEWKDLYKIGSATI